MSFMSIFRKLFGFKSTPVVKEDTEKFYDPYEEIEDQEIEDVEVEDMETFDQEVFKTFHEEMNKQIMEIQKDLEELLSGAGFPRLHAGEDVFQPEQGTSYRNQMLREPDSPVVENISPANPLRRRKPSMFDGHFSKRSESTLPDLHEDIDLDDEINERGLDFLVPPPPSSPDVSPSVSYSQTRISITAHGPDVKVEEKRTVCDSNGSEKTQITRTIGDQSFTVIRNTNDSGVKREESFHNMDEKEVTQFEKKWEEGDRPVVREDPPSGITSLLHRLLSIPNIRF